MTVPVGRLEAYLDADFRGFERALQTVDQGMETLRSTIRRTGESLSGLENFAGLFESTLRDLQQTVVQTSGPVEELERRTQELIQAWQVGALTEEAYAAELKQLKVDVTALASATSTSAADMERLARVGQQVNGGLRQVTAVARRTAQGFEAFGVGTLAATQVAAGGIQGVVSAANSLQVFAIGNPMLIGILSGLAALASAYALLKRGGNEAAEANERFVFSFQRMLQMSPDAIVAGAFRNWMTASDEAFRARGTADFSRLNAYAQMMGRRYSDAVRFTERMFRGGVHQPPGFGSGDRSPEPKPGQGFKGFQFNPSVPTAIDPQALQRAKEIAMAAAEAGRVALDEAARTAMAPGVMVGILSADLDAMTEKSKSFVDITQTIYGGLADGLGGIGVVLGEMLAGVGGGFKRLGAVIIQTIGGMLQSIGRSLIAFGLAGKAIKLFQKNPAAAVAAGIALIALGAALSASVAKQTASGGEGLASSGGFVSSPSAGSGSVAPSGSVGTGTLTVYLNALPDPSDPRQFDAFVEMLKAARERRVIEIVTPEGRRTV